MKTIVLITACLFAVFTKAEQVPVLLLSIDGFSSEYLTKHKPKHLLQLANNGLSASSLTSVFPSKTFPNHLSIVTGKYPAEHGIIANSFYRRDKKSTYSMGDGRLDPSWLKAEPIWITAEKQGIKSASYFWPESTTSINGITQTYSYPYDGTTSNETRINQILDWLQLPEAQQPKLITGYFSLIDDAGHNHGTDAQETKFAVEKVDSFIGQFMSRLDNLNIEVNLIIVSDHGMINIDKRHAVKIDKMKELAQVDYVAIGQTQLYIYESDSQKVSQIAQSLQSKAQGQYQVYRNGQFPSHWHFNKVDERMPDIIVNANAPYSFSKSNYMSRATHGYDSIDVKEMGGIFISKGPTIKPGKVNAFENIHVHQFIAELLQLPIVKQNEEYPLQNYIIR